MATSIAETIGQKELHVETDQRWRYFRFVVGAVLLTAAFMKSWELATVPVLGDGILKSRWLNIIAVELELALGVWLLSGLMPKLAWLASVASFLFFGLISLYKAAILQEVSCGCFGAAQISPWLTFGMDIGIVALLIAFRPTITVFHWKVFTCELYRAWRSKRVAVVAIVYLALAVPATYAMMSVEKNDLAELGTEFIGADGKKTILLEPGKWIGKTLPLLPYIEGRQEIDKNIWLVLLHKHMCSSCRDSVRLYQELASDFSQCKDCPKIMLLELPPFEMGINDSAQPDEVWVSGRLNQKQKWKIDSPILVLIDDFKVKTVFANSLDIDLIRSIWGMKK